MCHKSTKAMDRSPNGDTNFFDIIDGVLQVDTLVPPLFIFCLYSTCFKSQIAHSAEAVEYTPTASLQRGKIRPHQRVS